MPYLHGVYTSESPTSVVPTVDAASCLPFVIGTAPEGYTGDSLVRCRNWQEFKSAFGAAESYEGADPSTLAAFARQWYKRAGAGDALFYVLGGAGSSSGGYDYGEPIRTITGCHFDLGREDGMPRGRAAVFDAEESFVTTVSSAGFYFSPENPNMRFIPTTDPTSGTEILAVWAGDKDSIIGYTSGGTFTINVYQREPHSLQTFSSCYASESQTDPTTGSLLIMQSSGDMLTPIDGAFLGGIDTDVVLFPGVFSGEPCVWGYMGTPSETPFDVTAYALPSSGSSITDALAALDTVYERFGLVVTVVLCPRTGIDSASEIAAKVQKFGSGWSAVGLIDLPYDWGNAAPDLPLKSSYLVYCSPRCKAGSEIVDASCVVAGAMAATDASAGGFPYVSPSNKLAYIDGIVDENGDPLFLSQPDVNDLFNANAVVSFLHNAKGWVVWGNNTGYYSPSATDPKDRWISIRRTFCYIRNDFLVFGASRIDNPINKRQLDGVVNAYNQRLKGLVGVGAVNSASIALSDRNTAETLLGGAVFVDVHISPPPPIENLDATFEYDVEGFVSSLS